jgi:hypothetical protein
MRKQLGHVRSEGEYFHQLDVELIDRMRRRAEREEDQQRMAEACHIKDPDILDALERLGYSPTTVSLLCLVPLVRVAWADGWVTRAERNYILATARLHGVEENTLASRQLEAWLKWPPSEEFFQGSWRIIQAALELLPRDERKKRQDALIEQCKDVASSTWHLGKTEAEKALEEIQEQLEPHQHSRLDHLHGRSEEL